MKHSLYHENRILKLKPSFVLPFPNLNLDLKNKMEIYSESKTGISTNHICVGYRTCVYNSPDRYVFKILKHIFNGFSGRLFMTLRENHGVTYSSNVYTQYFENTGYFLIYTQTDPKNTFVNSIHQKSKLGVLPLLLKMCFDIKTKGITSDELETAKGNIKGKYLLNMENNDTLANHNGKNMILYGDNFNNNFVPYSDIYKEKIEKITKKEVNDVIQKYMNPENMVVGIMSSKKIPVNKILSVVNEYL
jgi:predicted Zn-dependent peptidase